MTVGNLVRKEVFELRDTSEPFQNSEDSPDLPTVTSIHNVIHGMESWNFFKRKEINFSMSDLEEFPKNWDNIKTSLLMQFPYPKGKQRPP